MGADFVELDVQASADGALVVFHDLDLDRLHRCAARFAARTLAELRELGIPTLEEVLELTRGRIGVMAELKSAYLFRRHDVVAAPSRCSATDDVVALVRTARPPRDATPPSRAPRSQHVGYGVSIRAAASYAWAVGFDDPRVTARGLARAHAARPRAHVYTVNDERRMRQLSRSASTGSSPIVRIQRGQR